MEMLHFLFPFWLIVELENYISAIVLDGRITRGDEITFIPTNRT